MGDLKQQRFFQEISATVGRYMVTQSKGDDLECPFGRMGMAGPEKLIYQLQFLSRSMVDTFSSKTY